MSLTPEDMLAAIVGHSQRLEFGKPDPLVAAARDAKVGKARCQNWRLTSDDGTQRVDIWDGQNFVQAATPEDRPDLYPSTPSADGKQTRGKSTFSIEEVAADAVIGMHERNWHSVLLSIGQAGDYRPLLTNRLNRIANRLKDKERIWPDTINRRPMPGGWARAEDYVPDLVEVVMRHFQAPFELRYEKDRAELFGVSESTWHKKVRQPFDQVAMHLWSWYFAGIGHIQHRILKRNRREN